MATTEEESCQGKRFVVPTGLKCLLEEMSREVLRNQPENIYLFLANYLEEKCRKQCGPECSKDEGSGTGVMPRTTNADINPSLKGEALTGTTQGYAPKIDEVAPFGYGVDGQPIPGPNRDAPFGYGPDGKPLTSLDPRAPNGYGPDGKPLAGAACVAPYGYDKDGKPLKKPDPYAPFGYHLLDGLPVATNDPTAPFGFGLDGNPLETRDPDAPLGYDVVGRPNTYPETVSFCGEKDYPGGLEAAQARNMPGIGQAEQKNQQQDAYSGDFSATSQDAQIQTGPAGALNNFNGQPFAGDANANSIQGLYDASSAGHPVPQDAYSRLDQSITQGLDQQESQVGRAQVPGQCDGGSVVFIGGPGTNLLLSYNPCCADTQAPINHMANAVSCGVQFGGQAGMVDCAGIMRSAMECMLSRVTTLLSGLVLQGINNNAPPAAGNRIGLTDYVTNPCFGPRQQQSGQSQSQPQASRTGTTGDGAETTVSETNVLAGGPDTEADSEALVMDEEDTADILEVIEDPAGTADIPEDTEDQAGTVGIADSRDQAFSEEGAQEASSSVATAAPSAGGIPITNDDNVSIEGAGGEEVVPIAGQDSAVIQASKAGISVTATPKQSQPIGLEDEATSNLEALSVSTTTAIVSKRTISMKASPKQSQTIGQEGETAANMGALTASTTTAAASKPSMSVSATPKQSQPIGQDGGPATDIGAISASSTAANPSEPTIPPPASPKKSQPVSQALSVASTIKGPATKPRQRCIPKELWQYVPITGGGVCPREAESAAGAPKIPPRQAGLAKLQVSKGCTQGSMSEYVEDILNRAKDIILSTRKYCGGAAPSGILPNGLGGQSAYSTGQGNEQPAICGNGGLAEPVGPGIMGKYLKEMAPQYQKMFARVLSPEDQTTLTLLTTVGTLLDTIEDTGLTRMDPVQLCSDKTLRELADVGEKMLLGLKEHLIKVRATPPENLTSSDPFMAQITREAYEALEIGAESLEVAVGLLRDVTNLCGELSEHPELLQQCAVDLEAARKKNESQYREIAIKQEEACKQAAAQQSIESSNQGSDTADVNTLKAEASSLDGDSTDQDMVVAEGENLGIGDTTGTPGEGEDEDSVKGVTQDEAIGNASPSTQDEALSAAGQEADDYGNQGVTSEGETANRDQNDSENKDGPPEGLAAKSGGVENGLRNQDGSDRTSSGNNGPSADGLATNNSQKASGNNVPQVDAGSANNSQKDSGNKVPGADAGLSQKEASAAKDGAGAATTSKGAAADTSSNNKDASGRGLFPSDAGTKEKALTDSSGRSLAISSPGNNVLSVRSSGGRIMFITVSFVVGMVVGYAIARSFGLWGINGRSLSSFFSNFRVPGYSASTESCGISFPITVPETCPETSCSYPN